MRTLTNLIYTDGFSKDSNLEPLVLLWDLGNKKWYSFAFSFQKQVFWA